MSGGWLSFRNPKFDIMLALSGIEDHGGAWIETGAVDNPRQGSRESLSFALGH